MIFFAVRPSAALGGRTCVLERRSMRRLALVLGALGLMCACLVGMLTGLETVFLNPACYTAIQDELDVYENVGISREEQKLIDEDLAAYLRGERDSLSRRVTLFDEERDCAFNEREISHMQDVRYLFEAGFLIRRGLLVFGIVLLLSACMLKARVSGSLLLSAGLFLLLGVGAALLVKLEGFSGVFLIFHQLVFDNDLWLLDPATDAMIRMLPEAFFLKMAVWGGESALCWGAAFYGMAAMGMAAVRRIWKRPLQTGKECAGYLPSKDMGGLHDL